MKKLLSRKFLAFIVTVVLTVFNRKWNLGLNEADLLTIGGTAGAFILGESYIDSKNIKK